VIRALVTLWSEPSTGSAWVLRHMLASGRPAFWKGLLSTMYGIHVSPTATIGARLRFAHPSGQVIGSGAVIGDDCTLYQHVTLGKRSEDPDDDVYPTLGDRVTVFAGAVLLGDIAIGDGATIAANAVVITDVEEGAVYGGVPARRLGRPGS
jgi:serine O-acetyltransferase